MDRRNFLKSTGLITTGSLLIPSFLHSQSRLNNLSLQKNRVIIIQLSGGNDGLNTIVPYGLDEYHNARTTLSKMDTSSLKINDQFAFNPLLKELHSIFQNGHLSILNSVGYPNPCRSHFRSMDIWHTASGSDQTWTNGWIGRYLDNHCEHAHDAIQFEDQLHLALKGQKNAGLAIDDPKRFAKTLRGKHFQNLQSTPTENSELQFLYKTFGDTKQSAEYIFDQYQMANSSVDYGQSKFGKQLQDIVRLIKSGIETPIYYTSLGGFDTHVGQANAHNKLMQTFDKAIGGLYKELRDNRLLESTTILVFSEFGRRLKENASKGTDHGAANVSFVIDGKLSSKAHDYNDLDLSDLHNGDPNYKIDFRSIYQDLLQQRLNVSSSLILNDQFDSLNLFS